MKMEPESVPEQPEQWDFLEQETKEVSEFLRDKMIHLYNFAYMEALKRERERVKEKKIQDLKELEERISFIEDTLLVNLKWVARLFKGEEG